MAEENLYKWTDNPTVSGVAKCDTDVLNDCLMHLKYENGGDFVSKSGDTMTGNLKLQSSWTQHVIQCITSLPYNQAPTSNTGVGKFQVLDKDGNFLMQTGCERYTDNRTSALLRVHSPDDASKSAQIAIHAYADGKFGFNFPMCTTKPTTTSTASNDSVAVVTQNYLNGQSWYRVWSDGWIEQGGRVASGNGNTATVTLLKPFKDTNYGVFWNNIGNIGGAHEEWNTTITSASQFKIRLYGYIYEVSNIMWYACGY
jgi:hypothetical protein